MEMKATGIVRRFDDLGRIVIPKEIRKRFGFSEGAPVDIFTTNDGVVLKLYKPSGSDAAQVAKDFLNRYRSSMLSYQPKFSIEGGETKCEVIERGERQIGIAKQNPDDNYDSNIGMVIAFCRASGCAVPDGIL